MQQSAHPTTIRRTPRKVAGVLAIAAGAILTTVGLSAGTAAGEELPPTQTVPLNNTDAPIENTSECPNAIDDFWHFVISGGQGYSFVSITLNLDGDLITFTGSEIILNPNNLKPDNVYVMVPDGYSFADLVKEGSSAEITPDEGSVKFVLSHFCDGPGRSTTTTVPETTSTVPETTSTVPETTSTVPETTSTVPETTSTVPETTSTVPETTSTVPETTSTVPETTSTVPETTTTTLVIVRETTTTTTTTTVPEATTTSVASEGPTTTTTVPSEGPTTTLTGSAAATTTLATELPATGSDLSRSLALLGGLLVLIGGVLLLTVRRDAIS